MDILSTLKSEYSRTLILIVIPGGIALFPFAQMLFDYFNITLLLISNNLLYISIFFLFGSIFLGFIIQDLGGRLEMKLDSRFCKKKEIDHELEFRDVFDLYLFNKKEEEYIITHYYRSMLVRLKFELHSIVSILLLWFGMFLRIIFISFSNIDWFKTSAFVIISLSIVVYLFWEAYCGVDTLHKYRNMINKKFKVFHPLMYRDTVKKN